MLRAWPAIPRAWYDDGMRSPKTQKTSIALDEQTLAGAKKAAAASGLTVSGLVSKLLEQHVTQQRKFEAMDRFVEKHAPGHRISATEAHAIETEWTAPLKPVRGRAKRSAA